MPNAHGRFEFKRWDETSYSEPEGGPKLTEARVSNVFHGDIEGSSELMYVMTYLTEDTGSFVGLEQVTGRLVNRDGSFVMRHEGTFASGSVKATLSVVSGTGTGGLAGITGEGEYIATHGEAESPYTLRWAIGAPDGAGA